jgi:hypothetical protein
MNPYLLVTSLGLVALVSARIAAKRREAARVREPAKVTVVYERMPLDGRR